MDNLISFVLAALVGGSLVAFVRPLRTFFLGTAQGSLESAPPVAPEPVEVLTGDSPTLIETLQHLSVELEALGERTTHPRELISFDPFQKAVRLLSDPAVTGDEVRQYIFGRLWTLQCAALEALGGRPDRQAFLGPVMAS